MVVCYVDGEMQARESIDLKDAALTITWSKTYDRAANPKRMDVMIEGRLLLGKDLNWTIQSGDTLKPNYSVSL